MSTFQVVKIYYTISVNSRFVKISALLYAAILINLLTRDITSLPNLLSAPG